MQVLDTALSGVKRLRPTVHGDSRGWFVEVFNAKAFAENSLPTDFVQDNQSCSAFGVLRGLHYQVEKPQGKLVRVLNGHIWDVAVDLRKESDTYGKWAGFHLRPRTDEGGLEMLWIPEGFAHGFIVLSETAEVLYKTTHGYFPQGERCIRWDDPELGIAWPLEALGVAPTVSEKDGFGVTFSAAEKF